MHIYLPILLFSICDCMVVKNPYLNRVISREKDVTDADKVVVIPFRTKAAENEEPVGEIFLTKSSINKKAPQFPRGHLQKEEVELHGKGAEATAKGGEETANDELPNFFKEASDVLDSKISKDLKVATEDKHHDFQAKAVRFHGVVKPLAVAAYRELFEETGHIGILSKSLPWKTKDNKGKGLLVFVAHIPSDQVANKGEEVQSREGIWVAASEVKAKLENRGDMLKIWEHFGKNFEAARGPKMPVAET